VKSPKTRPKAKRERLDLFLVCAPGLEPSLAEEAEHLGIAGARAVKGGVTARGSMRAVWRANLRLRGATRVLLRLGQYHADHLAQFDKEARRIDWHALLRPGAALKVQATCRTSKIYHSGAAEERIERAARDALGRETGDHAPMGIFARTERDRCTLSLDTSGDALYQRGFKQGVGKAPLRETLAAMFLRQCGYDGKEPVLDPMCGSGTFVIEAAENAAGLAPGRARSFAFEQFKGFDAQAWTQMRAAVQAQDTEHRFLGFDRDAGAVELARANAERAGITALTDFTAQPISALRRPSGPPGLVMVNPPYGDRIGERDDLRALYGTLGKVLREHFAGWRVGLVTSEEALARATGLPFVPNGPPVPHGALRVKLYRTNPL